MTDAIADTDILSTFGKIGRMNLLAVLCSKIYITPAVYRELLQVERIGFIWVASVKRAVELLPMTGEEIRETERFFSLYPQLGSGEIESFVLAQSRRLLCLTNVGVLLGILYNLRKIVDRRVIMSTNHLL